MFEAVKSQYEWSMLLEGWRKEKDMNDGIREEGKRRGHE
jgi:hypothetical protein